MLVVWIVGGWLSVYILSVCSQDRELTAFGNSLSSSDSCSEE